MDHCQARQLLWEAVRWYGIAIPKRAPPRSYPRADDGPGLPPGSWFAWFCPWRAGSVPFCSDHNGHDCAESRHGAQAQTDEDADQLIAVQRHRPGR